ncbi:aldehyde dehydrogenase [Salegentibacter sediminis]|uniref:aldehyde dehydrogenase n=1 Tax=Salegentibacter sediminis TaxID=1930251 RepID=UPI0009C11565|nr:aldehyde dehydrogenase [Salegentibacter sediminis]
MEETSLINIEAIFKSQKEFFGTQHTKEVSFRIEQLKILKQAVLKYEDRIYEALFMDLHKSKEEAFLTEVSIVLQEIDYHLKKLKSWAKPKKVSSPLVILPSSSKIHYEPLGIGLIISPWNYPFQLSLNPLVGAISSGCCAILKPSPDSENTSRVLQEMVGEFFPSKYISLVQGGKETNQALFEFPFDVIFFTGSSRVGKIVMKAAAEHLSKVVLELGGKSPCIVDKEANLDLAAKRIAWGKTINAGQTCIAPDYLLVHSSVKEELLKKIMEAYKEMYGEKLKESDHYARIINKNAFERLTAYLDTKDVYPRKEVDSKTRFIAPVILDNVTAEDEIMQEEIFGPILPVMEFGEISKAMAYINANRKPLALYYFGDKSKAGEVLQKTSSGGACINDTLLHIANHKMPFGGVGHSGMGNYHGHKSFLAFSHERAVVSSSTKIDLPLKYPPYRFFGMIKKILG